MSDPKETDIITAITEDDEGGAWVITYADLLMLLLVFFILLFAISSLNLEKYKEAIKSIRISLGASSSSLADLSLSEEAGDKPLIIFKGSSSSDVDIEKQDSLYSSDVNIEKHSPVIF